MPYLIYFLLLPFLLLADLTKINHPVSTTNPPAQQYFNEGLSYIYAFNHDLALIKFQLAAREDPNLAMAYWGMALALGPNLNSPNEENSRTVAYDYSRKALSLLPYASEVEKGYIEALALRYTNDPQQDLTPLRFHYRDAMKKVAETYPEDLDALTLLADSNLNLHPWDWWIKGKPNEGTQEAIDALEKALNRDPDHLGANHFYIHAIEGSPYPERALMSAHRLENLFPQSGHLLHMPCHIFLLVGDYESALKTNLRAIAEDRQYLANKISVDYPIHYLSHNLAVQTRIYMLREEYEQAIQAAKEVAEFLIPYYEARPHMSHFAYTPLEVYLYFHKWQEILDYKIPTEEPRAKAYSHFSRSVAFAALGKLDEAKKELQHMNALQPKLTDPVIRPLFGLAETLLKAKFARLENNPQDYLYYLNLAVEQQDQLEYNEPPYFFSPVRQFLGAALLEQKRFAEAEKAFTKALESLRINGRLLTGLTLSLQGQQKNWDASWTAREAANALKHAPQPLTLTDLLW